MQGREQTFDSRVGDPVPKGLGVAPVGHDPLVPHAREVLRQSRLRQADILGQSADRRLATLDELAEDEEASVVGEDSEQAGNGAGPLLERTRIHATAGIGSHFHRC
jgi:hypothetical protein